tara:strand:+ start:844 stop:1290 length:447 start_codon:yes stop_codon:yes gene_type:complete
MKKALIGAGCFWGIQELYRKLDGVINTEVGYSGGHTNNPTYEEVCKGNTNHAEVVKIDFDENKISFLEILNYFWDSHDPTQLNRQGPDIGTQYRSIIFCYDNIQLEEAKKSKELKQLSMKNNIVTEIAPFKEFFIAEDYHQLFICKRA